MSSDNVTVRYSDEDLAEFKEVIHVKLSKAMEQYQSLKEQLKDITENNTDDFAKDITDFSAPNWDSGYGTLEHNGRHGRPSQRQKVRIEPMFVDGVKSTKPPAFEQ